LKIEEKTPEKGGCPGAKLPGIYYEKELYMK